MCMNKKIIFLSLLLVSINLFVAASKQQQKQTTNQTITLNGVEILDNREHDTGEKFCYSGGKGSKSCSIEGGIEILGCGITLGCSVECDIGFYSCCGIRCTCERI